MRIDQVLQGYADDPMWANHAEVNKRYLLAAVKEIRSLREVLRPFVDRRTQPTSQMIKTINHAIDGMAPLALTVTKAQFMAASAMLDDVGGSHE